MSRLPSVSVVVCTFNGATRLAPTLAALSVQEGVADLTWEVVVIDNASTDGTGEEAKRLWPQETPISLRIIHEPRAGLSFARQRAISEATGEIISFIDDDNSVARDWVITVAEIFSQHPEVGACGGPSHAAFSDPAPWWFDRFQGYYAVGPQQPRTGDITDMPGTLLWGAGLSIRRSAMDALLTSGFHFRTTGRSGLLMSAGEDTEICFAMRAAGWRLWYDERLKLAHAIPAARLNWAYALRLFYGLGVSSVLIDIYVFALSAPPTNLRDRLRRTWTFQFSKCLKNIVKLWLCWPLACFKDQEGAASAAEASALYGRLRALLYLRHDFPVYLKQIRSASWNKRRAPK